MKGYNFCVVRKGNERKIPANAMKNKKEVHT